VAVNGRSLAVARIGPVPQSPLLHPSEDGVELLLADEKRIVAGLEGCPVVIVQADPVGRLDAHEMTEGLGERDRGDRLRTRPTPSCRDSDKWCG